MSMLLFQNFGEITRIRLLDAYLNSYNFSRRKSLLNMGLMSRLPGEVEDAGQYNQRKMDKTRVELEVEQW